MRTEENSPLIFRNELKDYVFDERSCHFSEHESCEFLVETESKTKLSKISGLSHLFQSIESSALPQERYFSQMNRRFSRLLTKIKIETLDRYEVLYAWYTFWHIVIWC